MYVLCAGMYRACSTWQYEVIAHLLERHRQGQRLGYLTGEEFVAQDQRTSSQPRWSVLKSHEGHDGFAKAVKSGRAIAIYAHRDVRDVVFSLMHKRGVTFEQLVNQGMIHQVLVNDRFWSRQPNVLTQRYESLVADPVGGVIEIAAHLKIEITRAEASEIAAEYSFQTNRKRTLDLVDRLKAQGVDLNDPSNLQYYDQRTLLHWNHLREGRPGNWREQATSSQRATLARLCDAWLIEHGYEPNTRDLLTKKERKIEAIRREFELVRAWTACTLRCASLKHPRISRIIKGLFGIPAEQVSAVPARANSQVRVDSAQANPAHRTAAESHAPSEHADR
ncbi:sulfotransferase domain-containing protein [Singulisphaera sp. PoT]|uniref:sulfotransferase domain-containing protein n=1 Tax=Singulisphaera sp. PoT TaxID=3411797 RepID=UPI003BF51D68